MKRTTKSLNPWMLSVLCLALATGAGAQQNQTPPNGGNPDAASSAGMPGKYNRASGIIGMEVRNQNDEDLGRIKDVVFDLKTERVSVRGPVRVTEERVRPGQISGRPAQCPHGQPG